MILPDAADGFKRLEGSLHYDVMTTLCTVYSRNVQVTIPKFKLESTFRLAKMLPRLGVSDLFVPGKADFSAMIENSPPGIHISDIMHKAFVEVNEEGTEAAAATATVLVMCSSTLPSPVEFIADHPVLFLIRENETGTILFLGRYMNPPQ